MFTVSLINKLLYLILLLQLFSSQKEELITVHIIPHSHMDAGWLFTEDHYYRSVGTEDCVECVFDSLLFALAENKERTFTISDIFFFNKWYNKIRETERNIIKELIKNKKINFVNGGWVMHDEATTTYKDQIDQMRIGLEFLHDEFNVRPKVAWQIDPFGHSSANVNIY